MKEVCKKLGGVYVDGTCTNIPPSDIDMLISCDRMGRCRLSIYKPVYWSVDMGDDVEIRGLGNLSISKRGDRIIRVDFRKTGIHGSFSYRRNRTARYTE